MGKLNIEFMNDESGFFSKVEDDLEINVRELIDKGNAGQDLPWDSMGREEFEQLFPDREFLLAWYPFVKGAKILEIGGGVGAITGLLCKVAQKVVTIEKKKSRADIIRKRYKDRNNLEVINCNYIDFAYEEKFDYIVIHDIFGYIKKYVKDAKPYEKFMGHMLNMIAEDGKILLATENRLGIKYFSGAIEDYSNKYFVGLDNFDGYDVIYTPTKKEIQMLLADCRIVNYKFYYPFPDNNFPTEIYTDDSLKYMLYGGKSNEVGWDRFELFNEREMYETLQQSGVVQDFANSFLLEIGKESNLEKMSYCRKIDRGHDGAFTYISIAGNEYFDSTGKKYIIKEGATSLQKKLSALLFATKRNDLSAAECCRQINDSFKEIKRLLEREGRRIDNFYTQGFVDIFGDKRLGEAKLCIDFCEINAGNIFCAEDNYTFFLEKNNCMVPVDYIMWLIIYGWYEANVWERKSRMKVIGLKELFESCRINREDIEVFKEWKNSYDQCLSQHMIEKHYVDWYKQDFIYPVDAMINGDLIMREFVSEDDEENQMLKEKAILDEIR